MPNELSLLLSGVPTIDVEDWQRNTEVHGQLIVGYPRRHNML